MCMLPKVSPICRRNCRRTRVKNSIPREHKSNKSTIPQNQIILGRWNKMINSSLGNPEQKWPHHQRSQQPGRVKVSWIYSRRMTGKHQMEQSEDKHYPKRDCKTKSLKSLNKSWKWGNLKWCNEGKETKKSSLSSRNLMSRFHFTVFLVLHIELKA
jgi:hypothetical protein